MSSPNSPNSPNSQSRRKSSLRLAQPPPIPVPPSLRASPYLNCPVFKQDVTSPRLPTEEEERWLQDTVPLAGDARPTSAAPVIMPSVSQSKVPGLTRHSTFPTSHLSPPPSLSVNATSSAHQRPRSGTVKQRVRSGPESTTNQPGAFSSELEASRFDGYHIPTLLGGHGTVTLPSLQVTPDVLGWSTIGRRTPSSGSETSSEPQFARLGVGDQSYFRETSFR